MTTINRARVLILSATGFEDAELYEPRETLLAAGAQVTLASPDLKPISGVIYDTETGGSNPSEKSITPDITLEEVNADDYDALLLPGGVVNPDKLRMIPKAVELASNFFNKGLLVASICHGPWLLVEADVIRGKKITGWPSIRTDLKNAGAEVLDQEVVVDGNLITSRMPTDIPAFTKAIIETLGKRLN